MERYQNKRIINRNADGTFRKAQLADVGIGGVCPVCHHFLFNHYYGDPRDANPDPRKFRPRCFTCEPLTEAEESLKAEVESTRNRVGIFDVLRASVETH